MRRQPRYRALVAIGLLLAALALVAACAPSAAPTATPTKAAVATATSAPTATPTPAPTPTPTPVTLVLKVITHAKLGDIVADASGKVLYARDGDSIAATTCTGNCLVTWPPYVPPAGNLGVPSSITAKLSVFTRPDGTKQITLNDQPLYYFVRDAAPGDATGAGLGNFFTRKADGSKVAISLQPTPTPTAVGGTPLAATATPTATKASNIQNLNLESFTVAVGTKVTWTNLDDTEHHLNNTTAPFDGDLAAKNATYSFTFTKAGSFAYVCTVHPTMKGTITVQ